MTKRKPANQTRSFDKNSKGPPRPVTYISKLQLVALINR